MPTTRFGGFDHSAMVLIVKETLQRFMTYAAGAINDQRQHILAK